MVRMMGNEIYDVVTIKLNAIENIILQYYLWRLIKYQSIRQLNLLTIS